MADLFLDIRDRHIRAIVATNGEILFQRAYPLAPNSSAPQTQNGQRPDQALEQGELASAIALIRKDSGIHLEQVHVILPSPDIERETHRLPRMPHQDAKTLITRKMAEKAGDESPQLSVIPMSIDQNQQEWLAEYVPTDILKAYKSEFDSARLKFKTATTALDATLHALAHIRESIFNAHAVFEINTFSIEAYYISSTGLLLQESLSLSSDEESNIHKDDDRAGKRRVFAILDILYRINSHYQTAHPMTPLQKIWLCGTESNISELSSILQDAMDVETVPLSSDDSNAFSVLRGFLRAYQSGLAANFIHPDILRRFPLRKKTGLLVYVATAILTAFIVVTAEYRHIKLTNQAISEKKYLAAQKKSQAASASFAKNMDFLKKLTSSQITLYPIFRELATKLPDGVYLESFNFSSKESVDTIDITATFLHTSDLGTTKTLSRLMDVVKQSPYLKNYREPSVTSSTKALNKNMIVKFSCEVRPLDTAK